MYVRIDHMDHIYFLLYKLERFRNEKVPFLVTNEKVKTQKHGMG